MNPHRVYLGLGSNLDPWRNLSAGLQRIEQHWELISVSGFYESAAIGFDGPAFINLVVAIETTETLPQLAARTRQIEIEFGRTPDCKKFSSRHLDIDILTFDELQGTFDGVELPRPEIFYNAFVLIPFAELCPGLILPSQTESLVSLQQNLPASQSIQKIQFDWRAYLSHAAEN
ncbi:MAG: 2-amino-4-hydroxy-6-hydroxymethyldihydropteridine diphosphokinase [Pseudomonadales bacterium]|nr:2-amino-4-hydroxy-6-hydroxymethyldihydropteridine diphosphokinase [Pseudomonadales bacterium]